MYAIFQVGYWILGGKLISLHLTQKRMGSALRNFPRLWLYVSASVLMCFPQTLHGIGKGKVKAKGIGQSTRSAGPGVWKRVYRRKDSSSPVSEKPPENYGEYVNNLRADQFTQEFRDEYQRALEESQQAFVPLLDIPIIISSTGVPQLATPLDPNAILLEGRSGRELILAFPKATGPTQTLGGISSRVPLNGIRAPQEPEEEDRDRVEQGEIYNRSTQASQTPSQEPLGNLLGPQKAGFEAEGNLGFGANVTVVRGPATGNFAPWVAPQPVTDPERVARAERTFRKFEPYLNTESENEKTGATGETTKPANNPAQKASADEEWEEVWVYEAPSEKTIPVKQLAQRDDLVIPELGQRSSLNPLRVAIGNVAEKWDKRADKWGQTSFRGITTHWSFGLLLLSLSLAMYLFTRKSTPRLFPAGSNSVKFVHVTPPKPQRTMRAFQMVHGGLHYRKGGVIPEEPTEIDSGELEAEEQDTKTDIGQQNEPSFQSPQENIETFQDDIRVAFDPHLHRWVLKRRLESGALSAPLAELKSGSVVRGSSLSSSDPFRRYKLIENGSWIVTTEAEQIIIAVTLDHLTRQKAG